VTLETDRLLLRKPRPEDADALVPIHADEDVMRFVGGVRDRPETEAAIERWLELWEANGVSHFIAERREDGAVLGRVGFVVWDTSTWEITTRAEAGQHAQPELGWTLAREAWGRGYATEGARAVREWFRGEYGDTRLISVISPDNARSQRVAEKLGATAGETITLARHGPAIVWVHP
jgi:RimJ/RimL family protein N-acetyltransferase